MSNIENIKLNETGLLEGLEGYVNAASKQAEKLIEKIKANLKAKVFINNDSGRINAKLFEENQNACHGFAWYATYASSIAEMILWINGLKEEGRLTDLERAIFQIGVSEYLSQMAGGIPISQVEFVRLHEFGLSIEDEHDFLTSDVLSLIRNGANDKVKQFVATQLENLEGGLVFGDDGLDETMNMVREQFKRFSDDEVVPFANEWHMKDELIPMELIEKMSELGVFGLNIPDEFGGFGMGKLAMCVVSEELSRGYIGVGSLCTRSEIAAELIIGGGTDAQKQKWLPLLASGEVLTTAVFTEPNTGSDLASLSTRAELDGDEYKLRGNKTWITHAARADMMTILARTNPDEKGYKGLSMFLAEKTRGDDENPFPDDKITGGEIEVLGYRGMKEYELAFDDFSVSKENLLGKSEGEGFKQLMKTFESARIQTAARAIGVAQSALDLGLRYSLERNQFNKPLIRFPRVANKLVMMAVEIMTARQISYYAARQKDKDMRCDLVAGMAKLLAAKIAWSCADNALQIHGGNGFALEYPISRVLCDARILSIFEGAAEIQAQVIAKRLLES